MFPLFSVLGNFTLWFSVSTIFILIISELISDLTGAHVKRKVLESLSIYLGLISTALLLLYGFLKVFG